MSDKETNNLAKSTKITLGGTTSHLGSSSHEDVANAKPSCDKISNTACDLGKKPIVTEDVFGKRDRPLMSVGAVDTFVSSYSFQDPVVAPAASKKKTIDTSSLSKLDSFLNKFQKSGMHTSKVSSLSDASLGFEFGRSKPMSVVLHKINLNFGGTQQTIDEKLVGIDLKKIPKHEPKCKVGNRNLDGSVEFCCGECEFCKIYVKKGKPKEIINPFKKKKNRSLSGKLFSIIPKHKKYNKESLERFFKNSKTLNNILKKNEVTKIKWLQHPASMIQFYGSTDAKINTANSMLGRDKGMEIKIKMLSLNFINYVRYAYETEQLSHYIDKDVYDSWVKLLRTKPKKLLSLNETIESSKMYTHKSRDSKVKEGGKLLYKAIGKTYKKLGPQQLMAMLGQPLLTAKKIGNVSYIELPSWAKVLDEHIRFGIFKENMIGALAFKEMLDGTKESYLGTIKAHRCSNCDCINLLGMEPTGVNYKSNSNERKKMFNIIKYASHDNKNLMDQFIECRLSKIEEITGLKKTTDKFYQMCACCGRDLLSEKVTIHEIIRCIFTFRVSSVKMGLLHHLEKMGYLDGATLDATGERQLIAMDYKTMQHQMSRLRQDVVAIPSRIDNEFYLNLQEQLVELEFCKLPCPSLTETCLNATTRALLTLPVNVNDRQTFVSLTKSTYGIEGVVPTGLLNQHKSMCEEEEWQITKIDNLSNVIGLMCTNIMQYHPNVIAGLMKKRNIKKIFYTSLNIQQQDFKMLCGGEIQCSKTSKTTVLIPKWNDRPTCLTNTYIKAWCNSDYIVTNNGCLTLEKVRSVNDITLTELHLTHREVIQQDKVVSAANDVMIEVPLLMVYNTKIGFKYSLMGKKKITLNREVYRRMMIRNITGDNTYKQLVEYGLALANMKYTINDRVINLQDVTAESIKYTAAMVYCRMLDVQASLSVTSQFIEHQGTLKGIMLSLLVSQVETFLSSLNLNHSLVQMAKSFVKTNKVDVMFGDHKLMETLLDIDNLMCYSRPAQLLDLREFEVDLNKVVPDCPHVGEREVDLSGPRCKCCEIGCAKKGGLCVACCVINKHKCAHQCVYNHRGQRYVCACCNCSSELSYCPCCESQNIEDYCYFESKDEQKTKPMAFGKKKEGDHREYKPSGVWPKPSVTKPKETAPQPTKQPGPAEEPEMGKDGMETAREEQEREMAKLEELRIKLMARTNEHYADIFAYGSELGWLKHANATPIPNEQTLKSYLIFAPMGLSAMAQDDVVIERFYEASGAGMLCGVHSLRSLFPEVNFDLAIIREITKEDNNYSTDQLECIAMHYELNLIVIQPGWCSVVKMQESDSFGAIVHSKALPSPVEIDHWQPCIIKQVKNSMNIPYWPNHFSDEDREIERKKRKLSKINITNKYLGRTELIEIELHLFDSLYNVESKPLQDLFRFEIKQGQRYLTNNQWCKHNPSSGMFSSKLNSETMTLANELLECLLNPVEYSNRDWYYDRPEEIPDCIESTMLNLGKQMIRTISQVMSIAVGDVDSLKLVASNVVTSYKRIKDNLFKVGVVDKTKPGDLIIGTMMGIESEKFVASRIIGFVIKRTKDEAICIGTNVSKAKKIRIKILKQSTGSCLRIIFSIMQWDFNRNIKTMLDNCRAIDAVAGWGKTIEINNISDEETTIIAQTSSAVENLINRVSKRKRICSVEKALVDKVSTKRLIVDEASMVTWEVLALACSSEVEKITLLGNTSQICVVDMYSTRGLRSTIDVLSQATNREIYLGSNRIGNPLATELSKTIKGFHTLSEHETRYCAISWSDVKWAELNAIANDLKQAVILCFYNSAVRLVKSKLTRSHEVTTIHKFQGKESDNVIIMQWCPHGNSPGRITLDQHQCFSAATRAGKNLIWISINEYGSTIPLHQRFGKQVGGFNKMDGTIKMIDLLIRVMSIIKSKGFKKIREAWNDDPGDCKIDYQKFKKLTLTLSDYMNLAGTEVTKSTKEHWWQRSRSETKTDDELMNELLTYQLEVKDEKKKINPKLKNLYEKMKNIVGTDGDAKQRMIDLVVMEIKKTVPGLTVDVNVDLENDQAEALIKIFGVNQVSIKLNFKDDTGDIETSSLAIIGKHSEIFKQVLMKGTDESKFDQYEYGNLDKIFKVKKTYYSEKRFWYINYFGPIIENGGVSFEISTKMWTYKVQCLAGCSLCGGILCYKDNYPIMVIRPSYDTADYREIIYDSNYSYDVTIILNFFKIYEAIDKQCLSYVNLNEVIISHNINPKGKFFVLNILVERMMLMPTIIKTLIVNKIFGRNDDICDKYDNVNNYLVQSHIARLKTLGFVDINSNHVPWFYTDCSRRPYLCRYDGNIMSAYIDRESIIWVTRKEHSKYPKEVNVVSEGEFISVIVRNTFINPVVNKIYNLMFTKNLGAHVEMSTLLRPMSEHMSNNDVVAGVVKKFLGQIKAKTYQHRLHNTYVTIHMQQLYPDITNHLTRYYNIVTTTVPYPENNMKGLIELICCQAIQKTKKMQAVYLTTNPCCSIMCGNYEWYSTGVQSRMGEWKLDKFNARKYYCTGVLANVEKIVTSEVKLMQAKKELTEEEKKILLDHTEKLKKIDDQITELCCHWYGNYRNRPDGLTNLVIGFDYLTLTVDEMNNIMQELGCNECLIMIPNLDNKNSTNLHKVEYERNHPTVMFPGSNEVLSVSKDIFEMCVGGESKRTQNGLMMWTETIYTMYGIQIVKLKTQETEAEKKQSVRDLFSPFNGSIELERVYIQYPQILLSPFDGKVTNLIVEKKVMSVDKRLARKMFERATYDDVHLEELLKFGRSYLQTQLYTEKYVTTINKNKLDELHAVCLAALSEKYGVNDQLEETMELISRFKINKTDNLLTTVTKLNSKKLLETIMSKVADFKIWMCVPDSIEEWLNNLDAQTLIIFKDEDGNETDRYEIGTGKDIKSTLEAWWQTSKQTMSWLHTGYYEIRRKIITKKTNAMLADYTKKLSAPLADVIRMGIKGMKQTTTRKPDTIAELTSCPEPVALVGEADLIDTVIRGISQQPTTSQDSSSPRADSITRSLTNMQKFKIEKIKLILDGAAQLTRSLTAREWFDFVTVAIKTMWMQLKGETKNWREIQELENLIGISNLNLEELTIVTKFIEENKLWEQMKASTAPTKTDDEKAEELYHNTNISDWIEIDVMRSWKPNIVVSKDGSSLPITVARSLRAKLRKEWEDQCEDEEAIISCSILAEELGLPLFEPWPTAKTELIGDLESRRVYEILCDESELEFNPSENMDCVWQCIKAFLKLNDPTRFKRFRKSIEVLIHSKDSLNSNEIQIITNLLDLNCVIVEEDGQGLFYVNDVEKPTIKLGRIRQGTYIDHCVLFKTIRGRIVKPVETFNDITADMNNNTTCQVDGHYAIPKRSLTVKCSDHLHINETTISKLLGSLVSKNSITTKEGSLRLPHVNNLLPRITRKSRSLTIIRKITDDAQWYEMSEPLNVVPGNIVLVRKSNIWRLILVTNGATSGHGINEKFVIKLNDDVGYYNIMINIGVKVMEFIQISSSRATSVEEENWCLNNETANYMSAKLGVKAIVGTGIGKLNVQHYDNRGHHKYNELDTLKTKSVEDINLHIETETTVPLSILIETLMRRDLIRVCVIHGELKYVSYCGTIETLMTVTWLMDNLLRGSIRIKDTVFADWNDDLSYWGQINSVMSWNIETDNDHRTVIDGVQEEFVTLDMDIVINSLCDVTYDASQLKLKLLQVSSEIIEATGLMAKYHVKQITNWPTLIDSQMFLDTGLVHNNTNTIYLIPAYAEINVSPADNEEIVLLSNESNTTKVIATLKKTTINKEYKELVTKRKLETQHIKSPTTSQKPSETIENKMDKEVSGELRTDEYGGELSGVVGLTELVDESGTPIEGASFGSRWRIDYGGYEIINPAWWYIKFPSMRVLPIYTMKHNLPIETLYGEHKFYRLNRIRFREMESTFVHSTVPETFFDVLTYKSEHNHTYPEHLQKLADIYLHGKVSWHVVLGEAYNTSFSHTTTPLCKRFDRVVIVTDYTDCYKPIANLTLIKTNRVEKPLRSTLWRLAILFANISDDCTLFIGNGRGLDYISFEMLDRVMREDQENFDIVSALHVSTFPVCAGCAKYNHKAFNDYSTFLDIYTKYGDNYGCDEIYLARYRVKMMWLYYLLGKGVRYHVEGKWLFYSNANSFLIEDDKNTQYRIDDVRGLYGISNFYPITKTTRGLYDFASYKWNVRDLLWKKAMQPTEGSTALPWWKDIKNYKIEAGKTERQKFEINATIKRIITDETVEEKWKESLMTEVNNCVILFNNSLTCKDLIDFESATYIVIDTEYKAIGISKDMPHSIKAAIQGRYKFINESGNEVPWRKEFWQALQLKDEDNVIQCIVGADMKHAFEQFGVTVFNKGIIQVGENHHLINNDGGNPKLTELKTMHIKLRNCELVLDGPKSISIILRLHDKNWSGLMTNINCEELLRFDKRITAMHPESELTELKKKIGEEMDAMELATLIRQTCPDHKECKEKGWHLSIRFGRKARITEIKSASINPMALDCVQKNSEHNYNILCQGVTAKFFETRRGKGFSEVVVEDETTSKPTTWQEYSNMPTMIEKMGSSIELRQTTNKDKLTEKEKRAKLMQFSFLDAYAMQYHSLPDLIRPYSYSPLNPNDLELGWDFELIDPVETNLNLDMGDLSVSANEPQVRVIDLWEDTDLRDWLTTYAPKNDIKVRSRAEPGRKIISLKTIMAEAPSHSRVVLTKAFGMELNAVTGRLGSVLKLRRMDLNVNNEIKKFKEAYFKPGAETLLKTYQANKVTLSDDDIKDWLSKRKDWLTLAKTTMQLIEEGLPTNPVNKVNVHIKTESLLKQNPIQNWRQTQARIIVWQPKELCALMSPIFLKIKQRLKEVLNETVLYTDGLTPNAISARLRVTDFDTIFEDDLEKQDRQTDQQLIDCEFEIMLQLGLDEKIASLWRLVHRRWRYKGKEATGEMDGMRLTGQATTALGNVITNLCVHSGFMLEHKRKIKLMLVLGDDNITFMSGDPNLTNYKRDMRDKYNMISKPLTNKNVGSYCSLICYRNNLGTAECGPDFVRMRRRFEVTGGGNHRELPIHVIQTESFDEKKKWFKGRRLIYMAYATMSKLTEWAKLHGNNSTIVITNSLCRDSKLIRTYKAANYASLDSCLEQVDIIMGPPNAIMTKGMSYLHMIGKNEVTTRLMHDMQIELDLMVWYDTVSCKQAIAAKYQKTIDEVDDEIKWLFKMISEPEPIHKEFIITTN